MSRTSAAVKNRYNAKAYDRLNILVPKGQKITVQVAADEVGESVNQFTNKALLARIGIDEWPVDDVDDQPE